MKSKLYTFLLFIIFFNSQKVKSQEEVNKNYVPNITVTTPQAASLSKAGEIPIDISTGRINYTIPIFEVKEGGFNMPINLSYNYSGLVLDETPGYGGVGWTFNIGGAITHSINGLNDEGHENDKKYIYNYINKLAPYDDYATAAGQTKIAHFLEYVANGIYDGEPDKYFINIGNISCSFYLDKDNNPVFLKNENYKLTGNSTIGFTLTDDQGINYIFNKSVGASRDFIDNAYSYTSSFLVTEINFPDTTNKIVFEYENSPVSYSDLNISHSLIKTTNELGNPGNNFTLRTNRTTSHLSTLKLKKIITNSYTLELQYADNPTEPAITVISSLSIKDKFSKAVKSFDFTYSDWFGRKINLLNVKFNGVITNEMEYDMSVPYPVITNERDYAKKDLWGYYNKNGIPPTANGLITPYENPQLKPDLSSTRIGALQKITYQTKGYSLITYEPNMVYMDTNNYNFPYDSDGTAIMNSNVSTSFANGGDQFEMIVINTVPAVINYVSVLNNDPKIISYADRNAKVILYKENQISNPAYSFSQGWTLEANWDPQKSHFTDEGSITINETGNYYIRAISTKGAAATLVTRVKQRPSSFNQTVGGLRVSTVQNCDFNGECITTVYNYNQDSKSSGVMLQKPEFYSGYSIYDNLSCNSVYVRQDYFNYTSIYPLSNYRGSPVLYKKVEKTDFGRNQNNQLVSNGKTIFSYFGNEVTNSLQDEESYFSIGLLDTKLMKDDSNNKVYKQKSSYLNEVRPDVPNYVHALQSRVIKETRASLGGGMGGGCSLSYPRSFSDFRTNSFRHEAKNYVLQQEVTTNYYQGDSLVQATSYDYNLNTGFLKSQTTKNSKKENLETKYFYPGDNEMATEPFRNELMAKNRIKTPLVVQNYNGVKLSEQKTEYTQDASTCNLLVPKYVYVNKGTASIDNNTDRKITYDKYDDKGNILQYTLESGTPVSIIWGYNKTQPIAKVENATYDQIASYAINLQNLSDADDDNCMSADCTEQILRKALDSFRTTFSQGMISTYTYNPLVGVTSVTDPKGISSYYEYDSFDRLKFVKDKDLNVLQKYCYNYKGQQVDCSDNSSTGVILYKSIARSGSFTKNNCVSGGIGSGVIYNQEIGASTSTISQAEADALGSTKFDQDGQAYANANGYCTFYSAALSGSFTKSNCPVGGFGSSVAFSQIAGVSSSNTSQADADAKARAIFNANGKAYANANGNCTFYSIALNGTFTKNNCDAGGLGSNVKFGMISGISSSNISQADADAKALIIFNANGQATANTYGDCTFKSAPLRGSFQKNNCAVGGEGSYVNYSLPSGAVTLKTSQTDADAQALNKLQSEGQAYANSNGHCIFSSAARSGSFTKNNCASGGVGSSVAYNQTGGIETSAISQEDADSKGLVKFNQDGQAYANANGYCTFYSVAISGNFTKNDCASGGYGSSVTFNQAAGVSSSNNSQAEADALGNIKFNQDGQAYANANGYCTFYSMAISGNFTKNDCASGGYGSSITFNQAAGVSSSNNSQAEADALGNIKFNQDGQAYANANGYCTFYSTALSGNFTKNDCASGGYGSSVTFSQAAGVSLSNNSQAEADALGNIKFNQDGQAYANVNGYCTFYSTALSGNFTKNDCASGGYGSSVTFNQAAGVSSSNNSQAEADALGNIKFNQDGQAYANVNGYCTFYSTALSGNFTKNDCASGGYGSSVTFNQAAGVSSSNNSQAEADALGNIKFNQDGQAYANTNGYCTFYSVAISGNFTKGDCASGGYGSSVTFNQAAGVSLSNNSQAEADALGNIKFNQDGQAYANTNGYCTFYSVAISGNFTKGDCAPGGNGSDVYYSQGFGGASSTNSQAEADALGSIKFNQDGQAYANANGYCTFYSAAKSGQFTRNNCAADGVPGSVIYNVPAGRYSDVSQAGADAQAQTDVNNNGQNYANTTALCTFYSVARSGLFSKNDCTGGALGSSVTFDQAAGAISSNISQDDANILGADKFYRDGNAYANASGTCAFYNTAVSRTANKNDCGAGRYGTAVTYTVPAGKYSSTISQANADQLAQNDLNNNYQNCINTNGACTSETYDTSIMDADSNLSRIWITVTSSSASHPDRKVNVVLTYSYRIGTKIYNNGRLSNNFILPAGVTSNTYIITLSFIGAPKLESYTIN